MLFAAKVFLLGGSLQHPIEPESGETKKPGGKSLTGYCVRYFKSMEVSLLLLFSLSPSSHLSIETPIQFIE